MYVLQRAAVGAIVESKKKKSEKYNTVSAVSRVVMRNGGAANVRSVDVPKLLLLRHVLHVRVLTDMRQVDRRHAEESVLGQRAGHQHDGVRVPVPDRGVPHVPVAPRQRRRQGRMRRPVAHPHRAVRRRRALLPVVATAHLSAGEHPGVHTARAPGHSGVLRHRLVADVQEQRLDYLRPPLPPPPAIRVKRRGRKY